MGLLDYFTALRRKHVSVVTVSHSEKPKRVRAATARAQIMVAENNPLVWLCADMIGHAVAQVPLYAADSDDQPIYDHVVSKLLRRPNDEQSRSSFLALTAQSLAITSNAYWTRTLSSNSITDQQSGRRIGVPQAIRCERPTLVEYDEDPVSGTILKYHIRRGPAAEAVPYEPADIKHLRHPWIGRGLAGFSRLEVAEDSPSIYSEINRHRRTLAENGGMPPGALAHEGGDGQVAALSDTDLEDLRGYLNKFKRGGDLEGALAVLNGKGGKFNTLVFPREDQALSIENQAAALTEVCNMFGVPPILLKAGEGSTFENQREARLFFWVETIIPRYVVPIVDAVSEYLGVPIVPDLDAIPALAEQREKRFDSANKATFLSVDERRAMVGYEPLRDKDIGSKIMVSSSMTSLEMAVGSDAGDSADSPEDDVDVIDDVEEEARAWDALESRLKCEHVE